MTPEGRRALRARVVAAVDAVHAHRFMLHPMREGRADPDRPAVEMEASLAQERDTTQSVAGGSDHAWRRRASGQASHLSIDRARYPGVVLRQGDRLRAVDLAARPWWEILAIDDRDPARLVAHLGAI